MEKGVETGGFAINILRYLQLHQVGVHLVLPVEEVLNCVNPQQRALLTAHGWDGRLDND